MSRRRRFKLVLVGLLLVVLFGVAAVVWQWKAPALVRRRLEQWIGHKVTVGSVAINHRLEIVARDVRIAGAPPFEAQTLAWADHVAVRLRGPNGFWSPSQISVDGLDVEYLGSSTGDNVRVRAASSAASSPTAQKSGAHASPRLSLRHVRLHGSLALPHAPHLEFRIPDADIDRATDGTLEATLRRAVVDVHGVVSLRASELFLRGPARGAAPSEWKLESRGDASVEVPGGGTFIDKVTLLATVARDNADVKVSTDTDAGKKTLLAVLVQPTSVDVTVDAPAVSLRPLAAAGAKSGLGFEHARASVGASVSVDRVAMQGTFEVHGQVGGVDVLHAAVDVSPWRNQSVAMDFAGSLDFASARVDLKRGVVKGLATTVSVKGWLEGMSPMRGSMVIETPREAPLACAAVFHGQPEPIKSALAGLELGGALGFLVSLDFNTANWDDLRLDIDVSPRCAVNREPDALAALLPILRKPKGDEPASSKLPLGPYHPDFTPLAQMPAHLPSAFVTAEDSKFFRHHGFDVEMIQHVLAQDLENRSFDRGASTITQQLAKNLFLSHRRTLARKLEEAVLTWRLQRLLSKDRTLELYLNVIELGPGIRGVKQAARTYFGKDVGELTPLESAHLAALTPNPHVLARRFRDGQVDEGWQQRLYDLLGMMKRHGRLSAEELAQARTTPLVLRDLGK